MDIMYWTFPHLSGKWSIMPGDKGVLSNGHLRLCVYWEDTTPCVDSGTTKIRGTRWFEGPAVQEGNAKPEKSGGSVNYYQVEIKKPTTEGRPQYIAECNDIIEALGMDFAEGNVFKALWRSCAERTLGKKKAGGDAVYDAEKMCFFSQRTLTKRKENNAN